MDQERAGWRADGPPVPVAQQRVRRVSLGLDVDTQHLADALDGHERLAVSLDGPQFVTVEWDTY
jgi:hypothetical protein